MAHLTMIGGTAYEIGGGKALIDATAYEIDKGKTLIGGTAYEVIFAVSGGKVILEVEKITSDTYAGETTYTGEQFILLDIYPKTNGTVKVTYGGLTKTITDTSGAEEPNAQEVFFGTFNGVSDSVVTPESGELTIEGDYYAFSVGRFTDTSKTKLGICKCIISIVNFENVTKIPFYGFNGCAKLASITIPNSVQSIENAAFQNCTGLTSITIPNSVTNLGLNVFTGCTGMTNITFDIPTGWYVTQTEGATSGTAVDVSNSTNNVTLLTSTYVDYYWYRT